MIPLAFAPIGERNMIQKIKGKPDVRQHLENLGFITGGNVSVVAQIGGKVIVNVKDTRIAISREMAHKIMLQ